MSVELLKLERGAWAGNGVMRERKRVVRKDEGRREKGRE